MKVCQRCKKKKPLSEFYKRSDRPDGHTYTCKLCAKQHGLKRWRVLTRAEKLEHNAYQRRWRVKQRKKVLVAYGSKCECCGETNSEFLTIDHINGGGTQHRKSIGGGGTPFFAWLIKQGFPKDEFRLLCMNCNFSMGKYGYCPHNKKGV